MDFTKIFLMAMGIAMPVSIISVIFVMAVRNVEIDVRKMLNNLRMSAVLLCVAMIFFVSVKVLNII